MFLDRRCVRVGPLTEIGGDGHIAAGLGVLGESPQGSDQEPREPHTLPPALHTHPVHPVVPVTDADQGKPVRAGGAGSLERSQAVLVHARALLGDLGQVVHLVLIRFQRAHAEKGDGLVEHGRVAGDAHIVIDHVRQPGEIIGEPGAHAAPALRVPPVLHVTFDELAGGRAQDVLPGERRLGVDEGHHVLELIALLW